MAQFDGQQHAHKSGISLKEYTRSIPLPDAHGISEVSVKGWYLSSARMIRVRVKINLSRTHNGRLVSRRWEEDWPGGGDQRRLRGHLQALLNKYYKLVRAGEWPEEKDYSSHCNPQNRAGFRTSTCPGCAAWYCTVER